MCFIKALQQDVYLVPNRVSLLRGIELQSSLTLEEIMDMTKSAYSNENWSKLSYFVNKGSFRPYSNYDLGRIIEKKIASGDWLIEVASVNCLFYETYLRMPTICDWTRQFSFFTLDDFIGSIGIYALNLSTDISEQMALKHIANVAQYQIASNSPFNRFMVAIQKENHWEFAYGVILPMIIPKNYTKSRRVKIFLFKEPSIFFKELLSGGMIKNISHVEYVINVRV